MNTSEEYIDVNGLIVKVVRTDIKNTHISIHPPEGHLRIAVPYNISEEAVRLAIISKLNWIKEKQKSFKDQLRQSEREYITGESHYFLGRRYLLDLNYTDNEPNVIIKNNHRLNLLTSQDATKEQRELIMTKWYKDEMNKLLIPLVDKWQNKIGIDIDSYNIRKMKTKWGSCNHDQKRILLNLELVKKPVHCLEYVLVHEMIHFLENTHNTVFVFYMDKFLPQWRTIKKELNQLPLADEVW